MRIEASVVVEIVSHLYTVLVRGKCLLRDPCCRGVCGERDGVIRMATEVQHKLRGALMARQPQPQYKCPRQVQQNCHDGIGFT